MTLSAFPLHLGYNLDLLPRPSLYLWHYFILSFPSICSIFLGLHLWVIGAPLYLRAFSPGYLAPQDSLLLFFSWLNSAHPQHSLHVTPSRNLSWTYPPPRKSSTPLSNTIISLSKTFSFEICLSCYTQGTKGNRPRLFLHLCNHSTNRGSRWLTSVS